MEFCSHQLPVTKPTSHWVSPRWLARPRAWLVSKAVLEKSPHHGWLVEPTPLKNDGRIVSWDDDMTPIWWESHKIPWFQTTNPYKRLSTYICCGDFSPSAVPSRHKCTAQHGPVFTQREESCLFVGWLMGSIPLWFVKSHWYPIHILILHACDKRPWLDAAVPLSSRQSRTPPADPHGQKRLHKCQ